MAADHLGTEFVLVNGDLHAIWPELHEDGDVGGYDGVSLGRWPDVLAAMAEARPL